MFSGCGISATGRACRTGGPPVASPVPRKGYGVFLIQLQMKTTRSGLWTGRLGAAGWGSGLLSKTLHLPRGWRIGVTGVHDDKPASSFATPHRDVSPRSQLLTRVRTGPTHDPVSPGGRADRAATKDVSVGRLPVQGARGIGDTRQIELSNLIETSDHVVSIPYPNRVRCIKRHPAIYSSGVGSDGEIAVGLHQCSLSCVARGTSGVDDDADTTRRHRAQR